MKFLSYSLKPDGPIGLAVKQGDQWRGMEETDYHYPGHLRSLLAAGINSLTNAAKILSEGRVVNPDALTLLPPIIDPGKILCVGLNYRDHAAESAMDAPKHPEIFVRFPRSLVGHRQPLRLPKESPQFDFEGELAAIIGKTGRHICASECQDYIAGYSIFNDGSIRDYQLRTRQWTIGKNFDASGSFGPYFVTADELPPFGRDLTLVTSLNGKEVQRANTSDMLFDLPAIIESLSAVMTLEPGDVIATGTPSGVGLGRTPQLFMRNQDICTVTISRLGALTNEVVSD